MTETNPRTPSDPAPSAAPAPAPSTPVDQAPSASPAPRENPLLVTPTEGDLGKLGRAEPPLSGVVIKMVTPED